MASDWWPLPPLRRWSPLTFLVPSRYVDRDPTWADFDLDSWSAAEYEWTPDPWNGFRDFAAFPRDTVERGQGDCEDYALVAIAWAVANGRSGVGIGFCWAWPYPWPTHVIAFDDERVYSSGRRLRTSVPEWTADSEYRFTLTRSIT